MSESTPKPDKSMRSALARMVDFAGRLMHDELDKVEAEHGHPSTPEVVSALAPIQETMRDYTEVVRSMFTSRPWFRWTERMAVTFRREGCEHTRGYLVAGRKDGDHLYVSPFGSRVAYSLHIKNDHVTLDIEDPATMAIVEAIVEAMRPASELH